MQPSVDAISGLLRYTKQMQIGTLRTVHLCHPGDRMIGARWASTLHVDLTLTSHACMHHKRDERHIVMSSDMRALMTFHMVESAAPAGFSDDDDLSS